MYAPIVGPAVTLGRARTRTPFRQGVHVVDGRRTCGTRGRGGGKHRSLHHASCSGSLGSHSFMRVSMRSFSLASRVWRLARMAMTASSTFSAEERTSSLAFNVASISAFLVRSFVLQ